MREPGGERARRRRRLATLGATALGVCLGGAWSALYLSTGHERLLAREMLPPQAALRCLGPFPKQGPDECGAYSLAMGLRVMGRGQASPETLVSLVSHQVPGCSALSGTLPWRLAAEARRRGLVAEQRTARRHGPARRLDALREHLAARRPVLLLIESERGSMHYVLAVGYDADGVDLYDPNYEADPDRADRTLDANGPRPGNRTLPADELVARWGRGGTLGLFDWWYLPLAPRS